MLISKDFEDNATYDIKFEEGKGVPRELCIAATRYPGNANVMFRTRQK